MCSGVVKGDAKKSGSWESQLSVFIGHFGERRLSFQSLLEREEATKLLELSWGRCHWRPWRWGCNLRKWCNLGSSQEYAESKRKRNWTRRPFSTSFTLSDVFGLGLALIPGDEGKTYRRPPLSSLDYRARVRTLLSQNKRRKNKEINLSAKFVFKGTHTQLCFAKCGILMSSGWYASLSFRLRKARQNKRSGESAAKKPSPFPNKIWAAPLVSYGVVGAVVADTGFNLSRRRQRSVKCLETWFRLRKC